MSASVLRVCPWPHPRTDIYHRADPLPRLSSSDAVRSAEPSRLLQDVGKVVHLRPEKTYSPQFVFYPLCSELKLPAGGEIKFRGMPQLHVFCRSGLPTPSTRARRSFLFVCLLELWRLNGQLWIIWRQKPTNGSEHATYQLLFDDVYGFWAPTFDFCLVNRSLTMKQQSSVCGFGYKGAAKTAIGSPKTGLQSGKVSGTESAPPGDGETRDHIGSSACPWLASLSCARNFQNQDGPGSFGCFFGLFTPPCSGPFGPATSKAHFGRTTQLHCCCQCTQGRWETRRPGLVSTPQWTRNQRFGTSAKPSRSGGKETAFPRMGPSIQGACAHSLCCRTCPQGPGTPIQSMEAVKARTTSVCARALLR